MTASKIVFMLTILLNPTARAHCIISQGCSGVNRLGGGGHVLTPLDPIPPLSPPPPKKKKKKRTNIDEAVNTVILEIFIQDFLVFLIFMVFNFGFLCRNLIIKNAFLILVFLDSKENYMTM